MVSEPFVVPKEGGRTGEKESGMPRDMSFEVAGGQQSAGRSVGSFAVSFLLQGGLVIAFIVIPILTVNLPTRKAS